MNKFYIRGLNEISRVVLTMLVITLTLNVASAKDIELAFKKDKELENNFFKVFPATPANNNDESKYEIFFARYDLNNDGKDEYFVQTKFKKPCPNYTMLSCFIFGIYDNNFKSISYSYSGSDAVKISDKIHGGYHDIMLYYFSKERDVKEFIAFEKKYQKYTYSFIDVSNQEDLIANNKIKPIKNIYVVRNGKSVPVSPPHYKSKDNCGKASELFRWRIGNKIGNEENGESLRKYYAFDVIDAGGFYLMKDLDGKIRIFLEGNDEFIRPDEVKDFVNKNKGTEYAIGDSYYPYESLGEQPIWSLKPSTRYKWASSDNNKYLYLKQKDCIVTFYKGNEF